jgi:hypothetical protein
LKSASKGSHIDRRTSKYPQAKKSSEAAEAVNGAEGRGLTVEQGEMLAIKVTYVSKSLSNCKSAHFTVMLDKNEQK